MCIILIFIVTGLLRKQRIRVFVVFFCFLIKSNSFYRHTLGGR